MMMISGFRAPLSPLSLPPSNGRTYSYSCDGRQKNFHVIDVRQWQYFNNNANEGAGPISEKYICYIYLCNVEPSVREDC